ncbi:MAG: hypothetical protein QOG56_2479 [Solirubrobacteraceae bacterium]|jgi:hypothetical protein|nr:hypothetical protein [Solirubrobacteraceae bacterium]
MGIGAIIDLLARGLRAVLGLQSGQATTPLLVALYSYLGLIALVLVFAWLTGTPLACLTADACEP